MNVLDIRIIITSTNLHNLYALSLNNLVIAYIQDMKINLYKCTKNYNFEFYTKLILQFQLGLSELEGQSSVSVSIFSCNINQMGS